MNSCHSSFRFDIFVCKISFGKKKNFFSVHFLQKIEHTAKQSKVKVDRLFELLKFYHLFVSSLSCLWARFYFSSCKISSVSRNCTTQNKIFNKQSIMNEMKCLSDKQFLVCFLLLLYQWCRISTCFCFIGKRRN